MGHEVIIEVQSIHFFAGNGPLVEIGACDHDCKHTSTAVIAWGPVLRLYELIECSDCGCRAWNPQLAANRGRRAQHNATDWRKQADVSLQVPRKDQSFPLAPRSTDGDEAEQRGHTIAEVR